MTVFAPDQKQWLNIPLAPHVAVCATESEPALAPDVAHAVGQLWDDARMAHPALFNGRIFAATQVTTDRIEGYWTEYRRAFAQLSQPGVLGACPLRQLAVCGVLTCLDGYVFAQRHEKAVYLPGAWQSPPAGTVEARTDTHGAPEPAPDLASQILAEAEEELGLSADRIQVGACVLAVTHPGTEVIDIGIRLSTDLPFAAVKAAWQAALDQEYQEMVIVQPADLKKWLHCHDVVPTTALLLDAVRAGGG